MAAARRGSSIVEVQRAPDDTLRVNDDSFRKLSQANPMSANELMEAKEATEREHALNIPDAIKLFKKGIGYSLLFSLAVIMEGYDLNLVGGLYAFPSFRESFGDQESPDGSGPVISAPWQSGISNGVQVGSIIGLYINGWISEKIGYKKTIIGSLILMIAFIFIPVFAQNIETILAGAVLMGLPWGVFQTLTVTYASEVMPTSLRAYLTTYVNMCWVMGQLVAAGVLRGFLEMEGEYSWRIPYMLQWMWPVPILIGAFFAPESPWWLVRKGRMEEAKKAVLKLTSRDCGVNFNVDDYVTMIKTTNDLEQAMSTGASYLQCFRGIDLRRTEIASVAWIAQAFCGSALMGFSVQFYQRAGLNDANSFNMNIGQYSMGVIGTVLAWWLMAYVGRRTIYLWGMVVMCGLLIIVGGLGTLGAENRAGSWGVGSLLLVYTFVYDFTVGPVCYSLVSEIPATKLRIKTVVLARNFYNMASIINNILMPRMIGVNAWNWGATSGFFWAGMCGLLWVWTYFRLPEPRNRTYGELDVLFENKVSARKFASTKIDQFSGKNTEIVADSISSDDEKATYTHVA